LIFGSAEAHQTSSGRNGIGKVFLLFAIELTDNFIINRLPKCYYMAIARTEKDMITISREEYEDMKETLEILSDPKVAKRILESIDQARKGKTISETMFAHRFGL